MQHVNALTINEAQAVQAFIGAAEKAHPVAAFNPETYAAQLSAAKLVAIDKVVGLCLQKAAFAIAPALADPEVDPGELAKSLAKALQTFLMIGPKDAFEIAPAAFTRACEGTKDLFKVDDLTIALCAFSKEGSSIAVTRNPAAAREWAKRYDPKAGTTVRINKGAYIVCKLEAYKD